jgi:hypothetical protein
VLGAATILFDRVPSSVEEEQSLDGPPREVGLQADLLPSFTRNPQRSPLQHACPAFRPPQVNVLVSTPVPGKKAIDGSGTVVVRGGMALSAAVPPKASRGELAAALREDAVRTLLSRAIIIAEALEDAEGEGTKSGENCAPPFRPKVITPHMPLPMTFCRILRHQRATSSTASLL